MTVIRTVSARDAGYQNVQYLRTNVTFADNGTAKVVGVVPAGALLLKPLSGISVNTAFNAGTTNTVNIGHTTDPAASSDADFYATALAAGAVAFVPFDEAVTQVVPVDRTITATVALTGAAATAGSAEVVIAFIPPN